MLYTHTAAGALQAEISVPAGEITEEKVEEQRLEQSFFKENAKAVLNRGSKSAGAVHVLFSFYIVFPHLPLNKFYHFVKSLYL